jgi:hypothetical protein
VRILRRAIAHVAYGFGYVPTSTDLVARVKSLSGQFHQLDSDKRSYLIAVGVWNTYAILCVWQAWRCYVDREPWAAALLGVMGALGCAAAVATYRALGRYYSFDGVHVRAHTESGVVIWQEPLDGLQYIVATQGRSWFLTYKLRWSDRSRTIVVYQSLKKALDRL